MGQIRDLNESIMIDKAIKQFAVGSTSIAKIAEAVGRDKANVHYYFGTKQNLYNRCIMKCRDEPTVQIHAQLLAKHYVELGQLEAAYKVIEGVIDNDES